jgi:NADPH:quinone reductase-like Zn-dependent oxidoreductase
LQPEPTITARIPPPDIITVLLLLPSYRFPAGNEDFPTGSYRKSIEPETEITKNGDVVLIHAGASGVGTAAIQLAKFFGAKVATTVGSDEKVDYCKKIDADKAVNYKHEPWINAMKEFNKDGFDSRWIIYSFQSGYQADKLSFTT